MDGLSSRGLRVPTRPGPCMPDTLVREFMTNKTIVSKFHGVALVVLPVLAIWLATGCNEFVHMGRINDREYASAVGGVKIEQQQDDGSWRRLGETDGSGKWWIMRSDYKGGGRIRLSKQGYGTQIMSDNEFMQASSLMMVPTRSDESDTNAP